MPPHGKCTKKKKNVKIDISNFLYIISPHPQTISSIKNILKSIIINILKKKKKLENKILEYFESIIYCEATAFLYASGFCDQILPSLQVYWKNLHLTISFKLLRVSHVLGFVQREEVSTKSRPIRDWRKDSTVGKYFGID